MTRLLKDGTCVVCKRPVQWCHMLGTGHTIPLEPEPVSLDAALADREGIVMVFAGGRGALAKQNSNLNGQLLMRAHEASGECEAVHASGRQGGRHARPQGRKQKGRAIA